MSSIWGKNESRGCLEGQDQALARGAIMEGEIALWSIIPGSRLDYGDVGRRN